ncbi:hypothetical protein FQ707_06510 [Bacteroidaceae bacterium HV4-6-C5C]|jgi:tRNA A-37 threonylcarbamoyl transferase component Bud32|nr:hypothetical protein FQ707_06510 [Bacteroidaceae bacterium HV4-6-C5C]
MKIILDPGYEKAHTAIYELIKNYELAGETLYKGRNLVKHFHTEYGEWVVKRYKRPSILQRFIYTFFRKSKAERAFIFAQKLHSLNIETPQAIAYIEEKKCGLLSYCYFISTVSTYSSLYPILVEQSVYDQSLVKALAAFLKELHCKGFLHGDSNLDNILYKGNEETGFQFAVIDTNRSKFKENPTATECLNNFKRVTHRRDLLVDIVTQYAKLRDWNVPNSVNEAIKALDKFERKDDLKKMLIPKRTKKE